MGFWVCQQFFCLLFLFLPAYRDDVRCQVTIRLPFFSFSYIFYLSIFRLVSKQRDERTGGLSNATRRGGSQTLTHTTKGYNETPRRKRDQAVLCNPSSSLTLAPAPPGMQVRGYAPWLKKHICFMYIVLDPGHVGRSITQGATAEVNTGHHLTSTV